MSRPRRTPKHGAGSAPAARTTHNRRAIWIAAAAFAALAAIAALLSGPRLTGWMRGVHAGPNVLLITLDTTRADHLPAYGYRLGRTPHLDRLANEGVLFERTVAAAPITLPSHVSLFTGLYPFVHSVRNNGSAALTDKIPTLATALHDRGYRTAAFVSAFVLDRRFGLARGFDHYDDQLETRNEAANVEVERRGDRTGLAAEEWLSQYAGGAPSAGTRPPFFIWLHLYDAHDPYDPPAPFHDAFADRLYDGEIAFDDAVVGSMLDRIDRLGMLSTTLVAVVGDHGESLGDHGEVTHSMFVYEAALRVPMIVWWPGHLPAARRVGPLVRTIDLTPLLLDLAGAPPLAGVAGQSLAPLVRGQAPGPGVAYGETYFPFFYMNWAPLRSIQDDRWKYIDAPAEELYDLSIDPQEQTNLAAREPGRTSALRRALETLTSGHQGPVSATTMDRETAEKLAALGYIAAAPAAPGHAPAANRDPKVMIGVFNRLRRANAAVHEGRLTEAEAIARDILERDRQNAFATLILASALMEQGHYRDALARYRDYSALVPTSADAHHWMAICHLRLGDRDRALAEEEAALVVDPRDADARVLRGGLLAERGRLDDAIRELRAAVEAEPNKAAFHVGLARILTDARRFEEADAEYRRALELEPGNPDAHAGYGVLLSARDQPDRAVAEFERSLELQPGDDQTRLRLADVLAHTSRRQEARTEYERLVSGTATPADIRTAARDRLARLGAR
ncbi:MAG TPA: sulfatase-like hydrolase/transferase [Vicinamibacterales bacterium]|nr:sulfatase-like hydrolase/transferase [Vicinamibacterales bacterium]